jgi:thiamine biosynthesis lipoprotein
VTRPPTADEVALAREGAGWRRLSCQDGAVFQPGGLRLDFSGIAKGYAVDLVAQGLAGLGFDSALVEIGGELHAAGIKPNGQPWWVDLEAPPGAPFDPCRFALYGSAIATSGDYRRVLVDGDQRFSHTLDPHTGYPVTHGLASVTVLAASAMLADAQATAVTVLGPDAGYDYAVRGELPALFVDRRQGHWRERMTPALAAMLA